MRNWTTSCNSLNALGEILVESDGATYLFHFVHAVHVSKLDYFTIRGLELRLAGTSFHETSAFEKDGEYDEENWQIRSE